MNEHNSLILVTGGTGKSGRRVAQRLDGMGRAVRIGSRRVEPPFDWNDRATWADALRGVGSAYVTYYPDIAFPGAVDTVREFAHTAVESGVRHLVLLSGRGEDEAQRAEEAVKAAGAEWTILRASWFNQNFSEHFLLQPVLDRVIALPAGDVAEPFVDVDDIADVAVAALTEDGHTGQVYEVTGPRLLTFADVASELSAAIGAEVMYLPVTPAEYAVAAASFGVPVEEIEALTDLFNHVLDGHNSYLTDGVQRALGRQPRDFAEYARAVAVTGVWNSPALEVAR